MKREGSKPPLSPIRIVGEILAGGVGGVVLGVAGLVVGVLAAFELDLPGGKCSQWVLLPVGIGYTLGSATGIYVVGNIGDETGSFLATLGGSIIGALGGALIRGLVTVSYQPYFFFSGVLAGAPIGATIGFNLTRRYKQLPPASETNAIKPDRHLKQ